VVKDSSGNDAPGVKVTIDGQPLEGGVSGAAFEIDPGEHKLSFEGSGVPTTEKAILVREGEKSRRVEVILGAASTSSESPPGAGTRRMIGLAVGGVGVVGLGLGAAFGAVASSKWSSAKTDCGAGCGPSARAQNEKSSAESAATISTVGFVAGAALVAGGLTLFLTAPSSTGLRVVPTVGASGGGLFLHGGF
jgi:hypothetical protein